MACNPPALTTGVRRAALPCFCLKSRLDSGGAADAPRRLAQVIAATNRADILDPALMRSGRLDRKIECPAPDRRQKRLVFQVCTAKMNLSDEVDLEDYVSRPDKISAADIRAICQEAGLQAVRKNRYVVMPKDFEKGYKSSVRKPGDEFSFYQ